MLGKGSVYQQQVGVSGSGALSHVYIQHPPFRCSISESQGLYYDDGNKLVLSPTSDQVLSWQIGPSPELDPPNSDSISEGPVLSIRFSLDKKVIGIQRSNHEVQFKNRETGDTFTRRCKPDSENILGFFWTDCPSCNIIFVKTSGLDLLSYEPELNALRLVEAKRFNVTWYAYTHETRMVLLASGMQCTVFFGFQFSSGGIIRLPKFDMTMTKAEANQRPVLAAEDIHIVTMYGRIYCLQLDRAGMLLRLYRFYRDAVLQQGTIPVYSSRIAISVLDNVLLVHQVDAKIVILYDIFLDSLAPISAPLPLVLRGTPSTGRQSMLAEDDSASAYVGTVYGESWTFLVPDLICDIDNGILWRMYLDLEAIAASSSDIPSILEFLQRRRSEPATIKRLCLTMMQAVILERRPISMIARAIDVLVASYSDLIKFDSALKGGEKRASERTQQISAQHVDGSAVASVETRTTMVSHEEVMKKESLRGDENEPLLLVVKDMDNESLDHAATLAVNRNSADSVSAYEAGKKLEVVRTNPLKSVGTSLSGETGEKGKMMGGETLDAILEQSSLQSGLDEHNAAPLDPSVSNQQGSPTTSVAISPDDMYHFVFAVVEDEMGGDPTYLVAIILEFLRSVCKEKFQVHVNLYVMIIQLLGRNKRYAEIGSFVTNKITEPSKEVALQLLESGRQNLQTRKLGMDMLRQLSLHHDYVTVLLQDGYYIEALRYSRKYKVITVRPSLFLEAAVATNDSQQLSSVLRFFSDFMPGFKDTSDCTRYQQILIDIS